MKDDKLFELLNDIDESEIEKAEKYTGKSKPGKIVIFTALASAAVILALAVGISIMQQNTPVTQENTTLSTQGTSGGMRVIRAVNAPSDYENMDVDEFFIAENRRNWVDEYVSNTYASADLQKDMSGYYQSIMENTLISDTANTVCSPVNMYIAFSMLAEVSDGNTRQQILDALDVKDMDKLRSNVSSIWNANYIDTPVVTSLLANSMWLNESVNFNDEPLNTLANDYHASSYIGDVSSPEMSEELRKWISENTKGLLDQYAKDISLDPQSVIALVSTIYYKAGWVKKFHENMNTQDIFHGTLSDSEVTMMHGGGSMPVYLGENFTSLGLSLSDSGSMYFLLPDEGVDVNTLPSDPEIFNAISKNINMDEHWAKPYVYLTLPKFNVSEDISLIDAMISLGITDVLNPAVSDFSNLSPDSEGFAIGKAEHAAMVEVDEDGVIGAAYTFFDVREGGEPIIENELYFTLDRPFMFIVTGYDGSILFSGIIRNL